MGGLGLGAVPRALTYLSAYVRHRFRVRRVDAGLFFEEPLDQQSGLVQLGGGWPHVDQTRGRGDCCPDDPYGPGTSLFNLRGKDHAASQS